MLVDDWFEALAFFDPYPGLFSCVFEALGIGGPYPAIVFSGLFTLRRRRRDCLQKIFCGRFVAKSRVRTALIIIDPPSLNQALCLGQGFEPVDI